MPGYFVVQTDEKATSLASLSPASLRDLGALLGELSDLLESEFGAQRVQVAKLGHTPGHSAHFHVMPVYDWMSAELAANERYACLRDLQADFGPDGVDLLLYVVREYGEAQRRPPPSAPSIDRVVEAARLRLT